MKQLKRWLSGFLVLCLCLTMVPIRVEAIAYSNYTGVDFKNENISTQRKAALTKAMQMVTVKWTCPADFPTWRSSGGVLNTVVATDGTSSTKFIKGKTYTGIPYSMADHTYDDVEWTNALSSGKITTSYMTGSYYGNGNTTAHGSDCSYFVYLALKAANAGSITYQSTAAMLNSASYKQITWEELEPADLFLKNGHVMMFVGMSESKYAVFECDAGDSKCAYNVYTKSQLSSYECYRYVNFSDFGGASGFDSNTLADLGTDFYAVILNTGCWKPINLGDDGFVSLETEVGKSKQVWRFVRQDDGSYTISSSKNGKLLEMYCGDTTPGNPVAAVSDDWGGNYQRWYLYPQGNGYVLLSKHFSESNLVLDLTDNNSADGTAIITYPRNNGAAQIWSIYRGEDIQLSGPNLTVSPGTSISKTTFTWNDVYGETRYDVKIWKNTAWEGDAYHIEWGANSGYSLNLPAGTYQAYVDAANHFETKMGNLVTFTVKEHAHSYTSKVTAPTCTAQGYTTYTCSSCGYSYKGNYTNALGHSYSYKTTKTPTTSATGTITGTCSRCSGTTTVTLPKLNTTDYTYEVVRAVTCTTNGLGRYIWKNKNYGTYNFDVTIGKSGHSYTTRVTAPTCTAQGYTTYTCNCGDSYNGNYTNALGHSYSYKATKAPTTSATGTITGTCSRCSGTATVTLPKLNTTDYGYSVTKGATCTATGTGRYTWKTTTYGSFYFDVTISATGHSYIKKVTAPSCTAQGYTTHTCAGCGDSYVDSYTAALGHQMGSWITVTAPTCTSAGTQSRTCNRCAHHETRSVAATGHDYENGSCVHCGSEDPNAGGSIVASGWSDSIEWVLTDDGVLTFSGSGAMKDYTYKSEMPWYKYLDQITSVVIGDGVSRIGDYAFYDMAIESIQIPRSVTSIGDYAFKNVKKLDHVVLPAGLTKLGESAFYACTSLSSIDIPASLWTIQPYTFKNCTSLASATFHEGNLQKISDGAFYGTALTSVELPDCLSILDEYVFKNCSKLAEVKLGSGLTQIREAVLYGTAISTIQIPDGVTSIKDYAFKNCTNLISVSLPESLNSVGEAAFYACTKLNSVELPNAVTSIGNYAFRKCTGLTSVSFGSGLTNIGESSFYGCTGLTELVIPAKVITIQSYAFKGCTGVTEVTLPESLTTLGDSAFHTCTGLSAIVIPDKVATIGEYCFSGSIGINSISFTGNAPSIGTGAFNKLAATASYPGANTTWTADVMQNYGGTITWKAA